MVKVCLHGNLHSPLISVSQFPLSTCDINRPPPVVCPKQPVNVQFSAMTSARKCHYTPQCRCDGNHRNGANAGRLLSRWPTRRRRLLWAVVAYHAYLLVQRLVLLVIDSELTWLGILHPETLFPVAVIAMMLPPAARRWFQSE
jgi:hypothetical protein